jgi:hypothetical protein
MEDIAEGGCGNDFALDDFELKECSFQQETIPAVTSTKPSFKEETPNEKSIVSKPERASELVMVAENLGSIPPNTSLMIINTKNNRYELFITSTEQKNAKIVIDLVDK